MTFILVNALPVNLIRSQLNYLTEPPRHGEGSIEVRCKD
jgi:hypothetical protein